MHSILNFLTNTNETNSVGLKECFDLILDPVWYYFVKILNRCKFRLSQFSRHLIYFQVPLRKTEKSWHNTITTIHKIEKSLFKRRSISVFSSFFLHWHWFNVKMYIKQIIIQGFKSYREQTVVEPFDPGKLLIFVLSTYVF